jgi:hypothetical protein
LHAAAEKKPPILASYSNRAVNLVIIINPLNYIPTSDRLIHHFIIL